MILTDLETGLVELLGQSTLVRHLRQIDSLPDLDADNLVGRFATDAPAVYIALGSFPVSNGAMRPKFGLACVSRNSRSQQAARHGDGIRIGLSDLLDLVMGFAEGASVAFNDGRDRVAFEVTGCDLVSSEALFQKGLYVGVVQIQTVADVRLSQDLGDLPDFKLFHAGYDIDAQQSSAEHHKWLKEPADHSTSAPGLSDAVQLQE